MDTDHPFDLEHGQTRDYRAISHARDGSVREVRSVWARSDADAIAQTEALVREFAMDLWDGLRFVEHCTGRRVLMGFPLAALTLVSG